MKLKSLAVVYALVASFRRLVDYFRLIVHIVTVQFLHVVENCWREARICEISATCFIKSRGKNVRKNGGARAWVWYLQIL